MDQETPRNISEKSGEEILHNIERARRVLSSLWHREINLDELRNSLAFQDQQYQNDLITHGYEMTALSRLNEKKESKERRDIRHLRIVSGSVTKRAAIEDALMGKDIKIAGIEDDLRGEDEKKSHEFLKKLILEYEARIRGEPAVPSLKAHTPDFYTIDVAEHKVRAVADKYSRNALFASDVVVLHGNDILEKPRDEVEALAMLTDIAGGKVKISSGSVLVITVRSGETVLMREGVVMQISLRPYSREDAEQYLRDRAEYKSVAGVIDYASPEAQRLIAPDPIRVEALVIKNRGSQKRKVYIDPALLPQMRDYCMGVPREMIQEMVRQAESWS